MVTLDAFSGRTIAFIVLVNDPGDGRNVCWRLRQTQWNGWSPTDVVFPSFVWIVGIAITISLGERVPAGVSRAVLFRQALRRAAILYVLGVGVYVAPAVDVLTQRLLGVLQRIAICYPAAVAICLTTGVRGQILWIRSRRSAWAAHWCFLEAFSSGAHNK